jgi:hypothetical protein
MIQAAIRIFKALPDKTRQSIVHQVVNVQGLKCPRTKLGKDLDKENFGKPNEGARLYNRLLFEHLVTQSL